MCATLLSDERSARLYPAVYNSFMVGPAVQVELSEFTEEDERSSKIHKPYSEWLSTLDGATKGRVIKVISRVQFGNFGNSESVGDGVHEFKLNFGAGYRVYYGKRGNTVVILLGGGDKGSQDKDIAKAKEIWVRINSVK